MLRAEIKFTNTPEGGTPQQYLFKVIHNLDEFGLNIESALINWHARLDKAGEINIHDFCGYIMSKDENITCIPAEVWDERVRLLNLNLETP